MLIARASKRDGIGLLDRQLRYDICEDDRLRGSLTFNPKERSGAIVVDGTGFTTARLSAQPEEKVYQAFFWLVSGAAKPPANPFALRDAAGQVLALVERAGQGFAVTCSLDRIEENFCLRRPGVLTRPFHLYRDGSDQSLGWVGQEKFFTRQLGMNLPASFAPAFQAFLVVLLLDLALQNLDSNPT